MLSIRRSISIFHHKFNSIIGYLVYFSNFAAVLSTFLSKKETEFVWKMENFKDFISRSKSLPKIFD